MRDSETIGSLEEKEKKKKHKSLYEQGEEVSVKDLFAKEVILFRSRNSLTNQEIAGLRCRVKVLGQCRGFFRNQKLLVKNESSATSSLIATYSQRQFV